MNTPTSVLIVDDHALIRDMLVHRLTDEPGFRVVGAAGSAEEAVSMTPTLRPDIVLMDIDMPGLLSFSAAAEIRRTTPECRVLFLSRYVYDSFIEQALEVGAFGYLSKEQPVSEMIEALRAVAQGQVFFSHQVQSRMVVEANRIRLGERNVTRVSKLSGREREVVQYLARGMARKQVAGVMGLSQKTVERHTANIMAKLGIHDRVELAHFAVREGLVPMPSPVSAATAGPNWLSAKAAPARMADPR